MNIRHTLSATVLATGLLVAAPMHAQGAVPITTASASEQTAGAPTWTNEQLITATVHQAWLLSNRNEATFFEMVTKLAEMSATNRGLTLPDTEEGGRKFGELVKKMAKADTDQLLYAVVDKAVVKVANKPAA